MGGDIYADFALDYRPPRYIVCTPSSIYAKIPTHDGWGNLFAL